MKKIISLSILMILMISQLAYSGTQPDAKNVTVNTSSFSKNLNSSDTNVQIALETLDQLNASGAVNWGGIGGLLSNQTDLQTALNSKITGVNWGQITGTLSSQTDLQTALNGKQATINVSGQNYLSWSSPNLVANIINSNNVNWTSLNQSIQSSGINWASLTQSIQSGGINWNSLNKVIQTGGINWTSLLNSEIQVGGINWTSLNKSIQATGINWTSIYSSQLQANGINWTSLNQNIQSTGVNWTSLNKSIQTGAINWTSIVNSEIQAPGINWTSAINDITEAAFNFTNNTTANATTSAHGLLPILPGSSSLYLNGNGAYTTPPGSGTINSSTIGYYPQYTGSTTLSGIQYITAGGINWTSLNQNIQATGINWTSLNQNIQSSSVNWTSLNAAIQALGVNWISLNAAQIQAGGINWTSLNSVVQSTGINWASLNSVIQSAAVNWTSLNKNVQSTGINWISLGGYASGYIVTATSNGGVNWQLYSPMVYPGSGIANSSGSGWNSSYSTTGSGSTVVLANTPTLITPVLGVATATSINGLTISTSTGTLSIANSKTATINNSLTFAGTDGTTMTFPTTTATIARTDAANTFTGHQTIEGVTSTGATGTGNFVFSNTPTLVTPVLGVATGTSLTLSTLTASKPVITNASNAFASGSFSGNTTTFVTASGSFTPGDCLKSDANGNLIDTGNPCGTSGPGGSSGSVVFNNLGSFSGNSGFTYTGTNVGIGSTLPGQILDVQGTIRTTGFILNTSPTNGYVLTSNSSGSGSWQASTASQWAGTNPISFVGNVGIGTTTALNQALTVQGAIVTQGSVSTPSYITGVNVGIGSTVPGQALDVAGTVRMTGFFLSTTPTSGYVLTSNSVGIGTWAPATGGSGLTGSQYQVPTFTGTNAASGNSLIQTDSYGDLITGAPASLPTAYQGYATQGAFINYNNTPDGPQYMAVNTGGGSFTGYQDNNAAVTSGSLLGEFSGSGVYDSSHDIGNGGGRIAVYGDQTWTSGHQGAYMNFQTTPDNTTSMVTGMTLSSSGNVGIGSTVPGNTLDVLGTVKLTSGTTGAVLCLTASHTVGHCTGSASCSSTCTCTCAVN